MGNIFPKSHLVLPEELPLMEYTQIFSCCSIWLKEGMKDTVATFDLFIRDMPTCRNFFAFSGLEEIVCAIKKWKYSSEQIKFLLKTGIITKEFAGYLKNFRFSGEIKAMPEGTIFFAGEPIVRITAPIIEANLLTMLLINAVSSNTPFLTKALRCVIAAAPKNCNGIYGTRAQSFESSFKSGRNSFIAGTKAIALPTLFMKYGMKMPTPLSIAYHAFIKSFPDELSAMRAMAKTFPDSMLLMIDTYEPKQGILNAIIVAKELEKQGKTLKGIMIDSGDLLETTIMARKMLDEAKLDYVKITIASNLDEYKILELKNKGIPADAFLVVTEGVVVADAPRVEVVYKLAQLECKNKSTFTAKFAAGKKSYPGKKQVFRIGKGENQKDIIGLENEKIGRPLLVEIMQKGKLVYKLPALEQIHEHLQIELNNLPQKLLDIEKKQEYKVETSQELEKLLEEVKRKHIKQ